MKFRVEWQELVYDAFDELESIIDRPPFEIQALSLDQAEIIAVEEALVQIGKYRPEGYKQHGEFIPKIRALIDENGICYQISQREKIQNYSIVPDDGDEHP